MHADTGGATLEFVTRNVIGPVTATRVSFDEDVKQNVKEEYEIENPVIVFFPSGNCQVFSRKEAERRRFLNQPGILNLQAVDDANSLAGQFKFAITEEGRQFAWKGLEQAIINTCISRGGIPLAQPATYSEESIFFPTTTHTKKGKQE